MSIERFLQKRQMLKVSESSRMVAPRLFDYIGGRARIFMFPNANHGPTNLVKIFVVAFVSRNIGLEFGEPPDRVCLWGYRVLGTIVPKTAVNKESNPRPSEYNIRTSEKTWNVHVETEAPTKQFLSKCEFRFSSLRLEVRHKLVDRWI